MTWQTLADDEVTWVMAVLPRGITATEARAALVAAAEAKAAYLARKLAWASGRRAA